MGLIKTKYYRNIIWEMNMLLDFFLLKSQIQDGCFLINFSGY